MHWIAAHPTFLAFLACSVGTLVLSLATGQRWAAIVAWLVIGNQALAQGSIDMFDAPMSLMVPMVGDSLLALALYVIYERHRTTVWAVTMFLIQFTICLADWGVAGALTLPLDHAEVLHGYYLAANILWLLLVACNAGPGARHVVVHLRDSLHRARAAGSLARISQRR